MFFKYAGSAFHAVGPETANPRGPKVLVNVRGMQRRRKVEKSGGSRFMMCIHVLIQINFGRSPSRVREAPENRIENCSLFDRIC